MRDHRPRRQQSQWQQLRWLRRRRQLTPSTADESQALTASAVGNELSVRMLRETGKSEVAIVSENKDLVPVVSPGVRLSRCLDASAAAEARGAAVRAGVNSSSAALIRTANSQPTGRGTGQRGSLASFCEAVHGKRCCNTCSAIVAPRDCRPKLTIR